VDWCLILHNSSHTPTRCSFAGQGRPHATGVKAHQDFEPRVRRSLIGGMQLCLPAGATGLACSSEGKALGDRREEAPNQACCRDITGGAGLVRVRGATAS
jgi:hypothetical protein